MLKRRATAVWNGSGAKGSGELDSTSGALKGIPYAAATRFENEDGRAGTNPEELIAGAHAGCFSMALAFQLGGAGHEPESLNAEATVFLEKHDAGWSISKVALKVEGDVPGISETRFKELAEKAKAGCPVSQALDVEITLEASLKA